MLSKCYSARERPASWARRPLRLRTRAPRPTLGLRAFRTAYSSPRPIVPRCARNSGQEGRAAAVGLLRCCWLCASSRPVSAPRTGLACQARFSFKLQGCAVSAGLQCEECCPLQLHYRHYAAECPAHFARVRGEPPPGWTMDQLGAVVKDPAAWTGQTLPTRRGPSTAAPWADRHTRGAPPGDALAEAARRTGM